MSCIRKEQKTSRQGRKQYQKASKTLKKLSVKKKQTEALIQRYMKEIPKQKEQCVSRTRKKLILIKKNGRRDDGKEWKELAEAYSREAAEEFQKTVNLIMKRKRHSRQGRFCKECSWEGRTASPGRNSEGKRDLAETEYLEAEKIL